VLVNILLLFLERRAPAWFCTLSLILVPSAEMQCVNILNEIGEGELLEVVSLAFNA
jgi:hypothetical protein